MISVILPCFNELRHGYLPHILANLCQQQGEKEILAVLSPNNDGSKELIQQHPQVRLIESDARNRAQRLNNGIAASQGEVVLLHHPATLLPPTEALSLIAAATANSAVMWGGFRHQFDYDHWLLRFTSWYSNQVRSRWSQILYLDHCLFAKRDVLEKIGGLPDMDIFEDTLFGQRLNQFAPPHLLPGLVITSARRFRQRGIYRQAAINQLLKLMYHAHLNPNWMNRLYERRSQINVSYDEGKGVRKDGVRKDGEVEVER